MNILKFYPYATELVGLIPHFLIESDPRPAAKQFNERYAFGGGWRPMTGWSHRYVTLRDAAGDAIADALAITYPGDPPYKPVALIEFRDEKVWVYPHAWVAIEKADDSVEISRMD